MSQDEGELHDEAIVEGGVFAYFSLAGDRFDATGMPADSAREVSNFREAILTIAREIWLDANPDRRRLPNGFYEAFDLRLVSVKPGSAQPQMILHRPLRGVEDNDWDEWSGIYNKARDVLTESLGSVAATGVLPTRFTLEAMRAIRRVGVSLHADENLTLGDPHVSSHRAVIDQQTRRVLDSIDDVVASAPTQHELEGVITEYDGSKRSFNLRTDAGVSVCRLEHFNESLADTARNVLALDGVTAPDVIVAGETLDETERRVQLFNVTAIRVVRSIAEKVLLSQLSKIEALRDGWLDDHSEAPKSDVIHRVQSLVTALSTMGTDVAVVPNSDGAVVLEWRRGTTELTAAIEPDDQMFLCSDDTESDELQEWQLPYDEGRLLDFLTRGVVE